MSDRTVSTAAREARAKDDVTALLTTAEARRVHFEKLLPSTISWETFKDTFKIAVQTRPSLLTANRESLWIALQKAALDGLMPDGREGALVVFNEDVDEDGQPIAAAKSGGKEKMVQWMPMVRGLIKMARNTGEVSTLRATLIFQGETFMLKDEDGEQSYKYERLLGADFDDSDRAIVGCFAVINFKDGSWDVEVMSRSQIERVRSVSKAKSPKAPWQQWYGQMSQKTVLRRLLKRQPSASVARIEAALDRDDTMTIEGDPVVEQREIEAPKTEPRKEGEKPTVSDEDPADAALGKKVATASGPVQEETKAPPEPPKPQEQPKAEPFEVGATDETGEPVLDVGEDGIFRSPGHFAVWFELAARNTTNIENLFENNSDAAGDAAKADPEAGNVIKEALAAARKRLAPRESERGDLAEETAALDAMTEGDPIAVPTGPGGKRSWQKYWELAKAAILALPELDAITTWEEANRPVYSESKAVTVNVEQAIAERRSVLTPPAEATDRDRGYADEWLKAIREAKTGVELSAIERNAAFISQMGRWERERVELFVEVRSAGKARKDELSADRMEG